MKILTYLCIFIALFLLSGTADAKRNKQSGTGNAKQHQKFEDCDKRQTGALTFEEAKECFPGMTQKRFEAIDANKDGTITKEELKTYRAARKKAKAAKQAKKESLIN